MQGRAQQLFSLVPGLIVVALMLVWAVHDGGYDADTWYWGALVLLAAAGGVVVGIGPRLRISREGAIALAAFATYVAWSYLSMAWAQYPGAALQGSNRALMYLLAFGLLLALPWTAETALLALLVFTVGIGVIEIVLLIRLASADHVARLVIGGRLSAPTGYFNTTAALFTIEALVATALATLRRLPAPLRGLLIAFASAGLQLALIVQSRGWLFTLPLVLLVAIIIVPDRLRMIAAALLPIAAVLAPLHPLLHVYQAAPGPALNHAAARAGKDALILSGAVLVAGTLIAFGEQLARPRELRRETRRALGVAVMVLAVAAAVAGGVAATHGHPFRFISRQWRGFSHETTSSSSVSHFADVGGGRYDIWRVALEAFVHHPIGGLGQDNFADYYVKHRRTAEEPAWTHSIELRLLAHTGVVGLILFAVFIIAALVAASRARRRRMGFERVVVGAALLPMTVWLIHGSTDWFWEMPAVTAPVLGFLAVAAALSESPAERATAQAARPRILAMPRALPAVAGAVAFLASLAVLLIPYLAVREESIASTELTRNPVAALRSLSTAANLNPLDATPGLVGGTLALRTRRPAEAQARFRQSLARDPGAWFPWLGAGLAASALGERAAARHDFELAASINNQQPAIRAALRRIDTAHPLSAAQAFRLLVVPS